jgi:hypothetical protein
MKKYVIIICSLLLFLSENVQAQKGLAPQTISQYMREIAAYLAQPIPDEKSYQEFLKQEPSITKKIEALEKIGRSGKRERVDYRTQLEAKKKSIEQIFALKRKQEETKRKALQERQAELAERERTLAAQQRELQAQAQKLEDQKRAIESQRAAAAQQKKEAEQKAAEAKRTLEQKNALAAQKHQEAEEAKRKIAEARAEQQRKEAQIEAKRKEDEAKKAEQDRLKAEQEKAQADQRQKEAEIEAKRKEEEAKKAEEKKLEELSAVLLKLIQNAKESFAQYTGPNIEDGMYTQDEWKKLSTDNLDPILKLVQDKSFAAYLQSDKGKEIVEQVKAIITQIHTSIIMPALAYLEKRIITEAEGPAPENIINKLMELYKTQSESWNDYLNKLIVVKLADRSLAAKIQELTASIEKEAAARKQSREEEKKRQEAERAAKIKQDIEAIVAKVAQEKQKILDQIKFPGKLKDENMDIIDAATKAIYSYVDELDKLNASKIGTDIETDLEALTAKINARLQEEAKTKRLTPAKLSPEEFERMGTEKQERLAKIAELLKRQKNIVGEISSELKKEKISKMDQALIDNGLKELKEIAQSYKNLQAIDEFNAINKDIKDLQINLATRYEKESIFNPELAKPLEPIIEKRKKKKIKQPEIKEEEVAAPEVKAEEEHPIIVAMSKQESVALEDLIQRIQASYKNKTKDVKTIRERLSLAKELMKFKNQLKEVIKPDRIKLFEDAIKPTGIERDLRTNQIGKAWDDSEKLMLLVLAFLHNLKMHLVIGD